MTVIVIGGGPAGMMAAACAAQAGAEVTLFEKNASLGKKLLISGGGRCNFTNAQPDVHELAAKYGKKGSILLSPLSKFSSQDCLKFFESRGMPYKIEDHWRAFPESNSARSVLDVLQRFLSETKVTVKSGIEVKGFEVSEGRIVALKTYRDRFQADLYILATGGTSHPETGSTGDAYEWLTTLGHKVRIPEPSLVPLAVTEPWIDELQGLSCQNVRVTAWVESEKYLSADGKILFTHFGLSGPLILNLSTKLNALHKQARQLQKTVTIKLDFFPTWDAGTADRELQTHFAENKGKKLKNALPGFLPPRLVARILTLSSIDGEKPIHQLTKIERQTLVRTCKEFSLTFKKLMDESRAVVSSGGVNLDEVDFRTMRSKLHPNLAIVGDLLDFDRPSGGYSLQICWSTAWVAGASVLTASR